MQFRPLASVLLRVRRSFVRQPSAPFVFLKFANPSASDIVEVKAKLGMEELSLFLRLFFVFCASSFQASV